MLKMFIKYKYWLVNHKEHYKMLGNSCKLHGLVSAIHRAKSLRTGAKIMTAND